MAPYGGRVRVDLGSGDGHGAYRWACREADRLFIASDANPSALLDIAWRAGRKPARGGISNLICIAEPLDVLARELGAVADHVTVILPWESLFRSVATPEPEALQHIAALCLPGAAVEIVFSYDEQRDAHFALRSGIPALNEEHIFQVLPFAYQGAGLPITTVERISQEELAAYETTWARRLAFGRLRKVWRIKAIRKES